MGFFSGLEEEIKALNSDVKNVAKSARAKKLRKKLLWIGLPIAIIGYTGFFVSFIALMVGGSSFESTGVGIAISCAFVFFALAAIGTAIASYGFEIVIAGYKTGLIDEAVGNNCPECGDIISNDEIFCSKCGYQVRKECSNCKTINSHKDKYCKKCGKEL